MKRRLRRQRGFVARGCGGAAGQRAWRHARRTRPSMRVMTHTRSYGDPAAAVRGHHMRARQHAVTLALPPTCLSSRPTVHSAGSGRCRNIRTLQRPTPMPAWQRVLAGPPAARASERDLASDLLPTLLLPSRIMAVRSACCAVRRARALRGACAARALLTCASAYIGARSAAAGRRRSTSTARSWTSRRTPRRCSRASRSAGCRSATTWCAPTRQSLHAVWGLRVRDSWARTRAPCGSSHVRIGAAASLLTRAVERCGVRARGLRPL